MIKAAIFDMDGLLIDSEPLWKQAKIEILGELGVTVSEEDAENTTGIRIDHTVEYFYQRTPWEGKSKDDVIDDILKRVIQLIDEKRPMMSGVLESIAFFRSQGLKLAVASSSPLELIRSVLEGLELEEYFQAICSAGELEYPKPHPEVYINTAKALEVDETECLALEDSISGLLSAKSARMKTIAIPDASVFDKEHWAIADRKLSSLLDINRDVFENL